MQLASLFPVQHRYSFQIQILSIITLRPGLAQSIACTRFRYLQQTMICCQSKRFEQNRVPYFDGFVGTRDTFFDLQAIEQDRLPNRWARLWKMHGSINWSEDENGKIHHRSSPGSKQLIYPSHLKYDESRRMPYLAILDRLRTFLGQPAAILIVSGYSFGDEHLNEVILQGLQGNSTASAFVLMYSRPAKHECHTPCWHTEQSQRTRMGCRGARNTNRILDDE